MIIRSVNVTRIKRWIQERFNTWEGEGIQQNVMNSNKNTCWLTVFSKKLVTETRLLQTGRFIGFEFVRASIPDLTKFPL